RFTRNSAGLCPISHGVRRRARPSSGCPPGSALAGRRVAGGLGRVVGVVRDPVDLTGTSRGASLIYWRHGTGAAPAKHEGEPVSETERGRPPQNAGGGEAARGNPWRSRSVVDRPFGSGQ